MRFIKRFNDILGSNNSLHIRLVAKILGGGNEPAFDLVIIGCLELRIASQDSFSHLDDEAFSVSRTTSRCIVDRLSDKEIQGKKS